MAQTTNSKMIENEVIFAGINKTLKRKVARLTQNVAKDLPLEFFCECSNEDCTQRLTLDPAEYDEIHLDRRMFVVLKGHEVLAIEKVIEERHGFSIVLKNAQPDTQTDGKLNKTDL